MNRSPSSNRRARRPRVRNSRRAASSRAQAGSARTIDGPFRSPIAREQVFLFNRRLIEYTFINQAGTLQIITPPSTPAGAAPLFGFNSTGVSEGVATNDLFFYSLQFALACLGGNADIINMFAEYQVRNIEVEVALLNASNWVGGSLTALPYLPELTQAIDPTSFAVPTNVSTVEQYQNTRRQVLSQERPMRFSYVPRMNLVPEVGSAVIFPDNNFAMWTSTIGVQPVFSGGPGVIRNWPQAGLGVRVTGLVTLACRRPL